MFALLLCIADVAALATTVLLNVTQPDLRAAMIGVSFVAGADLVSTYIGFMLCPWTQYPLADP